MTSYEAIARKVAALDPSDSAVTRNVAWVTPAGVVGLSRTTGGRIEIFLTGNRLAPSSQLVQETLEYQTWHRTGALPPFEANRLVLPGVGHYDQVAVFICTELLRGGADADLALAFKSTEPLIELAIKRLRLSDQSLLGLAGELLLLDALMHQVEDERVTSVAQAWHGWKESLRDFKWGQTGVEVKTTTRSTSSHLVQGMHQIERRDDEDGPDPERGLRLVSIGLQWTSDPENAYSIPELVDSVTERLVSACRSPAGADMVGTFLAHVREYGSGADLGYDHRSMAKDIAFARPFIVRFVRGYDMTDLGIKLLRAADVAPYVHMDKKSITYRVELPTSVTGDLNPIVGLHQTAKAILDAEQL